MCSNKTIKLWIIIAFVIGSLLSILFCAINKVIITTEPDHKTQNMIIKLNRDTQETNINLGQANIFLINFPAGFIATPITAEKLERNEATNLIITNIQVFNIFGYKTYTKELNIGTNFTDIIAASNTVNVEVNSKLTRNSLNSIILVILSYLFAFILASPLFLIKYINKILSYRIITKDNQLNFSIDKTEAFFLLILALTLINGFYNSIMVEYMSIYPFTTFLPSPDDLHADLIKVILAFNTNKIDHLQDWPTLYQNYSIHNSFNGIKALNTNYFTGITALNNGFLTTLHLTPLSVVLSLSLLRVLLFIGPVYLLLLYYIFIVISIITVVKIYSNKINILITLVILFSYPVLTVLDRGNVFAFICSICLIVYLSNIVQKKHIIWSILLLALAVNLRPNASILSLLFFVFGVRNGFKYIISFTIIASMLLYSNLIFANFLYPTYNFVNFLKAVNIYFKLYVLGDLGNTFNNSLFGMVKTFAVMLNINQFYPLNYDFINKLITLSLIAYFIISIILFFKKKINEFELAFIGVLVYTLSSSVFATYHLIVFFYLLLLPLKNKTFCYSQRFFNLFGLTSVFVLVPKNYIFISGISLEVILNPLIMFTTLIYIWVMVRKGKKYE